MDLSIWVFTICYLSCRSDTPLHPLLDSPHLLYSIYISPPLVVHILSSGFTPYFALRYRWKPLARFHWSLAVAVLSHHRYPFIAIIFVIATAIAIAIAIDIDTSLSLSSLPLAGYIVSCFPDFRPSCHFVARKFVALLYSSSDSLFHHPAQAWSASSGDGDV
jgi:hypothetical protein